MGVAGSIAFLVQTKALENQDIGFAEGEVLFPEDICSCLILPENAESRGSIVLADVTHGSRLAGHKKPVQLKYAKFISYAVRDP
jgi:hypothetical protein